jgi:Tfp pilus assembly protein PilX
MKNITTPKHQKGIILIVILVLLTGLTLSASVGMQQSILQERLAGNLQDRSLAFEMAEAVTVDAQDMIKRLIASAPSASPVDQRNTVVAFFGSTAGLFNRADVPQPNPFAAADWNVAIAHCSTTAPTTPPILCSAASQTAGGQVAALLSSQRIVAAPQYMVVHLGEAKLASQQLIQGQQSQDPPTVQLFKILARGFGGNPNTVVMLETVYAVR